MQGNALYMITRHHGVLAQDSDAPGRLRCSSSAPSGVLSAHDLKNSAPDGAVDFALHFVMFLPVREIRPNMATH